MILFVLILFTIFKAKNKFLSLSIYFFTAVFLLKVFFILNPQNLWLVCVNDDSTPIQNSFEYEYFDSSCAKSFNNLNSEFTDKVDSINYKTYDEEYQWLGANSANFPLGYLNHSKFNIYELRRDWLPFEMNIYKRLDKETQQLEINYIGEVTIRFDNGSTGYGIPSRYWNENTVIIDIPASASFVTVKYSFTQWKIKHIPTLKSGYPYEKFAKLIIKENGSLESNANCILFLQLLGICF